MGNHKSGTAEERGHLEWLLDVDRLLSATLGGFAVQSALSSEDPEVTVDVLGRTHQVEPPRLIADKRRTVAARRQVLFAD